MSGSGRFQVTILGCGSAKPTTVHFPSAQLVNVREKLFLVDCGEGTQLQLCRAHANYNQINNIFISHLHGDHCLGLICLISTMGLGGRTAALNVYAPAEFGPMLDDMLRFFCATKEFEVVFHPLDTQQEAVVYDDRSLTVTTIPLNHRVACCGFLFREKEGQRHIRPDMMDFYQVPPYARNSIKAGADWTLPDGTVIANERLTLPPTPPRSYAYCSDTLYMPRLGSRLRNVSAIYHEATYLHQDLPKAQAYYHSTARQAAMVARDAQSEQLIIGHFSARYHDESQLLDEAREVFGNTILASELLKIDL